MALLPAPERFEFIDNRACTPDTAFLIKTLERVAKSEGLVFGDVEMSPDGRMIRAYVLVD